MNVRTERDTASARVYSLHVDMHDIRSLFEPMVGKHYRSRQSGKPVTVTAIDSGLVHYRIGDFEPKFPLFTTREKFIHMVGLNDY